MKHSLDTPIYVWLGGSRLSQNGPRIGIEVEVEGTDLVANVPSRLWTRHEEGSLRNGIEYVTTERVRLENLPETMLEFKSLTSQAKFRNSIRTSVHVHVDVRSLTLRELYVAVCLFYLLEDTLVTSQGPTRIGNLFCLRGRDAESIFNTLFQDAGKEMHFQSWNNHNRYASQNLSAVKKFGSLEYRFLKGMTDPAEIEMWVRALYSMVFESRRFKTLHDLIECYNSMTYPAFFASFFTKKFVDYIKRTQPILSTDNNNLGYIIHLTNLLDKKHYRKFNVVEDIDDIGEFEVRQNDRPKVKKIEYVIPDDLTVSTGPTTWTLHNTTGAS